MIRVAVLVCAGCLAVGSLAAAAPSRQTSTSPYRIVFSSDRDGHKRSYSMSANGSRLAPLLPRGLALAAYAVSADGSTVAYSDVSTSSKTYVSRADGTNVHRVPGAAALSRDGRLLAFERHDRLGNTSGVWVVRSDGTSLRRVPADPRFGIGAMSPDATALALLREVDQTDNRYVLILQPLRGASHVLARGSAINSVTWSPDGRWIGFARAGRRNGLYLVRSDGGGLHRVAAGEIWAYAWSPDARRLAVTVGYPEDVAVVGADGAGFRRLHLHGPRTMWELTWSPDGRLLAFDDRRDELRRDIWVVNPDGSRLRALTHGAANDIAGWTRLVPHRAAPAPLLPSERVVDPRTVATRRPVTSLSADGSRAAFVVGETAADCEHLAVWTQPAKKLDRLAKVAPCSELRGDGVDDVGLAGSRVVWVSLDGCGNYCDFSLRTATLEQRRPKELAEDDSATYYEYDYHVHGAGDLVAYNDGGRLVRLDADGKATTIRRGDGACCVDSVAHELIAIREKATVEVVDREGTLVRAFSLSGAEVSAARLDTGRIVLAGGGSLKTYDLAAGRLVSKRGLPRGSTLADVDGGVAVLRRKDGTIEILRLADGRSLTLATGKEPRLADFEPRGLYYSYATRSGDGRVVFMPRAELTRRLGG